MSPTSQGPQLLMSVSGEHIQFEQLEQLDIDERLFELFELFELDVLEQLEQPLVDIEQGHVTAETPRQRRGRDAKLRLCGIANVEPSRLASGRRGASSRAWAARSTWDKRSKVGGRMRIGMDMLCFPDFNGEDLQVVAPRDLPNRRTADRAAHRLQVGQGLLRLAFGAVPHDAATSPGDDEKEGTADYADYTDFFTPRRGEPIGPPRRGVSAFPPISCL